MDAWQAEAVRRWGAILAGVPPRNWEIYVRTRTATPCPHLPSPFALLQERYCSDGWRLLVACQLMTRMASGPVKERCLGDFFALYSNPTAFLRGDVVEMERVLYSLGLFADRLVAMTAITQRWLAEGPFAIDIQGDNKIRGAGPFTVDRCVHCV